MNKITQQLMKICKVSYFIFKQYLKIIYSYSEVQVFFTDLYIKSRSQRSLIFGRDKRLPVYNLNALFPGIDQVNINIYAQYKSLSIDIFSSETKYLVSPHELFALSALVKYLKPKSVFEMGTFKGWTLANLSLNLSPDTQIFSIDLQYKDSEDFFIDKILKEENIKRFYANTFEFDFNQYEGMIDFVFIDAGHERKDVINDTKKALEMLSANGTIVWHDYNVDHKDVYNYLNELKNELPIFTITETSIAIYSRSNSIQF